MQYQKSEFLNNHLLTKTFKTMKKIFAICAVAFVAAAMFTSCNKPEDNALTVKFNKEQWTAQQVLGNQVDNLLGMEAYETNYEDA